jgi:hypothetical protein
MENNCRVLYKMIYFVSFFLKKKLESDKMCLASPFSFSTPGR